LSGNYVAVERETGVFTQKVVVAEERRGMKIELAKGLHDTTHERERE
jgi:hypothetical protein